MISKVLHKKESWCSRIEILKNILIIWWLLVQLNQRQRYTTTYLRVQTSLEQLFIFMNNLRLVSVLKLN